MNEPRNLNRPTAEGRLLGAQLARLCDTEAEKQRAQFPDMLERCTSCAFRGGTIPNGCPETLLDAIKCVVEQRDFLCHEKLNEKGEASLPCMGWMIMLGNRPAGTVPWPYTNDPAFPEWLERGGLRTVRLDEVQA